MNPASMVATSLSDGSHSSRPAVQENITASDLLCSEVLIFPRVTLTRKSFLTYKRVPLFVRVKPAE